MADTYLLEYTSITVYSGAMAATAAYMGKWNKLGICKPATSFAVGVTLTGAVELASTAYDIYTIQSGASTKWAGTALSAAAAFIYDGPVWPYMQIVMTASASSDTTFMVAKFKEHF
jgi:hypothetical protein